MKKNELKNIFTTWFQNTFNEKNPSSYNFSLGASSNPIINQDTDNYQEKDINLNSQTVEAPSTKNNIVSSSLDSNLKYMKIRYNSMINSDIEIRQFTLNARNKQYDAFIIYIDGMINSNSLNEYVLKPLMLKNTANSFDGNQMKVVSKVLNNNITVRRIKKFDIEDYIFSCLIPQNGIKKSSSYDDLCFGINSGNCVLFIDTINTAFDISIKGFQQRSLDKPENEMVIRGEQVAFTENLRTNTSLMRRYTNNENLIIESLKVGKISQTDCAVCYLKNIANSDLIAEVKYRINNLNLDYIISSGQLEQLIQDNGNVALPQIIATERPDRVITYLFEGRVAIIVNRITLCSSCPPEFYPIFLLLLKI